MSKFGNASLGDFISLRLRELDEAAAEARERLREIDAERDQLQRAASAAGIVAQPAREQGKLAIEGVRTVRLRRRPVAAPTTIKQAVLAALDEAECGLTALEILPKVNWRLGTDYHRSSLSPQLSRLKADGLLVRSGNIWDLTERVTNRWSKIEAADEKSVGDTSAASMSEQPEARGREAGPGGGT